MGQIKTKQDDARAVLNNPVLAQKLVQKDLSKRVGKSNTETELVIKSHMRECPNCKTSFSSEDVDCPECGKMVGKATANGTMSVLPEEMQADTQNYSGEDLDELQPNPDVIDAEDEPTDELTDETEQDVDEGHESAPDDEVEKHKAKKQHTHSEVDGTEDVEMSEDETNSDDMSVEASPEVSYRKSDVEDELVADAIVALESVQKALASPGMGNKGELLAHAANLVSAVRDYAHSLAATPDGGITAEGQAAATDMNPAPQPMQKVGGNPAPIPEEQINQHPQIDQQQEEAMEDPEVDAAETPEDEAEEGRLMFSKQPTDDAKKQAMQPPTPVKAAKKKSTTPVDTDVKVRTQANADVKSATISPAEAFLQKWSDSFLQTLDSGNYSRLEKRELMQKSLNEFVPAVVDFINQTTEPSQVDLTATVQAAVTHAVEQVEARYKSQTAGLEAKVETLIKALTEKEVESVSSRKGPQRKSLGMLRPDTPTQSAPQAGDLSFPALSGDQVPIKKFRASELAQSTVSGPRY